MTRSSGSSLRSTPSSVVMRFALAGAAHDDLAAFELVEIEGVGGMADFVEHVVAGVGHVADAALVDEFEAMRDVRGRRRDLDSAHDAGGVTRAAFGVLDDDARSLPGPLSETFGAMGARSRS